jgi:hypothetical protein
VSAGLSAFASIDLRGIPSCSTRFELGIVHAVKFVPGNGVFHRTITKTENPDFHGIRVGEYFI